MQIHELNYYNGVLGEGSFLAVDDGNDTGKISTKHLLENTEAEIENLDETLNARIDNIIAGGDAPSAAEIIDARLGAAVLGSVPYASLGDAIRGQATALESLLSNFKTHIANNIYKLNTVNDSAFEFTLRAGQYINPSGSYQSNASFNSYEFEVEETSNIYFVGNPAYLTMAVYSSSYIDSSTIIGSRMKDSTLPTEESPYTVSAGQYVVITVSSNPLEFYSNYGSYEIKKSALGNVFSAAFRLNTEYDTDFSVTLKPGVYTNASGDYTSNASFNSYELVGTEDSQIYFDPTGFGYLSLCVYNGTPSSSTLAGDRMRESTLPTVDSPYTLASGYVAVVSITISDTLRFFSDYKNIVFNNSVRLAQTHIQQVKDSMNESLNKLYITNTIESDHITISTYAQLSETKKLRVDLYKYVYGPELLTPNANSNVWVMGGVYVTNNNYGVIDTVVLPLEWDCAIKEVGASDFMGGKQHGDEIYDAYYIYADGRLLDPTQPIVPFYCDALELVQTSKLNRVGQPTDYLLKHSKHIKITPKNVFCEQSFKALQTFNLNLSYVAMLPIAPSYADAFIRNGKAELEDITDAGYTVTNTQGNKVWANIVSDDSIIRFEADSDSDMTPKFAITKGDNDHKCYYSMNAEDTSWDADKVMFSKYDITISVTGQ